MHADIGAPYPSTEVYPIPRDDPMIFGDNNERVWFFGGWRGAGWMNDGNTNAITLLAPIVLTNL